MPKTLVAPKLIVGSWAEASEQGKQFADHQVRLTILPLDKAASVEANSPSEIPGLIPPKIGSGTFEDIVRLNSFSESEDEEEDDIMEAINENRAMRRQLASEKPR